MTSVIFISPVIHWMLLGRCARWWWRDPNPYLTGLPSCFSWCCPIPVAHCTFFHLDNTIQMVWNRGKGGHMYYSSKPKPQQRWRRVYNFPPVWDNIIKKRVMADRPRRWGPSSLLSRTTSPTTSGGQQNWWRWQAPSKTFVKWSEVNISYPSIDV